MLEDVHINGSGDGAKLDSPVVCRRMELTAPYTFVEKEQVIGSVPDGCLLLRMKRTAICPADLRYITFSRPPEIMRERIPMCVFHEGTAEVTAAGGKTSGFAPGRRVAVVPNVPCHVHDPVTYPGRQGACRPCREGVKGDNLCEDVKFLGSNVNGLSRSHLLHPAACAVPVPDDVPDDAAVLVEILTIALRGVRCGSVKKDDTVLVMGAGAVGYLTALAANRCAQVPKDRIYITDVVDDRLKAAGDFATPVNAGGPGALAPLRGKADRVFECAGGKAMEITVEQALECAAPGGTIVLLGVHEDRVGVRIRQTHLKGLTLIGTHRSDTRDFVEVMEVLKDPFVQEQARRIMHPVEFPATAQGMEAACRTAMDPGSSGKVIIDWETDRKAS